MRKASKQLRAKCYGQDRYYRRYWSFPRLGGVFVEAMESADPDLLRELQNGDKVDDDKKVSEKLPLDEKNAVVNSNGHDVNDNKMVIKGEADDESVDGDSAECEINGDNDDGSDNENQG